MTSAALGEVLVPRVSSEWIDAPANETFVTVRMRGLGAVPRLIGEGKTPRPFRGSRVTAGDLIYSRIDARNGAFAMVPDSLGGAVVSKDFPTFGLRADRVEANYLSHLVRAPSFWARFQAMSFGATNRQRIDERLLLAQKVYLPSLPEQRRIAAILDEADALRTGRRQSIDTLAELPARLLSAHADSDWRRVTVGEIADLQGGLTVNARRQSHALRVGYLRVANVFREEIELSDVKDMGVTESEIGRTRVRQGDVLVVEGHGNIDEVGRAAVVRELPNEPLTHQNHIFRLRPRAAEVTGQFLELALNSTNGRDYFRRVANTTSGLNTLNATNVRAAPIRLAPLVVQHEIAADVERARATRENALLSAVELDDLFASLQHRAFRGEL